MIHLINIRYIYHRSQRSYKLTKTKHVSWVLAQDAAEEAKRQCEHGFRLGPGESDDELVEIISTNYSDRTVTSLEKWSATGIMPKWTYFTLVKFHHLLRTR